MKIYQQKPPHTGTNLAAAGEPLVMETPISSFGSSWHRIYENSEFSVDPILKFSYHHLVLFDACD